MAKPSITQRQLINVIHHNRSKFDQNWFGRGECIVFVEKIFLSDGRKIKRVVLNTEPTIKFHMTSEAFQEEHKVPMVSYPADKCDEYEVPVSTLLRDIAKLTGQTAFYNETKGPGANRRRQLIHGNRFLHGSDVNLTDTYIDRYMEHYKDKLNTTHPLDIAFADIEVDIIDHVGFPDEHIAPCPVSLISYFHRDQKKLTQFALLKSARHNPLAHEIANDPTMHNIRIIAEANRRWLERKRKDADGNPLPALVEKDIPWEELAGKLNLAEVEGVEACQECIDDMRCTDYELIWFEDELDLIKAFLHHVNEVDRPDVLAWWNMRFDIMTLINRIRFNGEDPAKLFTPKDFGLWQMAEYSEDTYNSEPADNNDIFAVTSYTIYIDQMTLFAGIRKGAGKRELGLNDVLEAEISEGKFNYDGELRDLPYRNYSDFLLYGGIDVVPMGTLEAKTDDIAMAYQLSMTTRTRIHKILKKTICLRNLACVFYRERGLILSNNRNRLKERVATEQFRGAYTYLGSLNLSLCWKTSLGCQ